MWGIDKKTLYNAMVVTVFILLCVVVIGIMHTISKLTSASIHNNRYNYEEVL